jgi:hypothetical protein
MTSNSNSLKARARLSDGTGADLAICEMVERGVRNCVRSACKLVDLDCGSGNFWKDSTRGQSLFSRYVGSACFETTVFQPRKSTGWPPVLWNGIQR